jgi:Dyp-type peroxidase family
MSPARPSFDLMSIASHVQANVLESYAETLQHARFLFVALPERVAAARTWLARFAPRIAYQSDRHGPPRARSYTIALAHRGLVRLGVEPHVLARFPDEFRSGMRARAAELCDDGPSAPERWDPIFAQGFDALIGVYAEGADALAPPLLADEIGDVEIRATQACARLPGNVEHFGFKDVCSQPELGPPGTPPGWRRVSIGQFLRGYPRHGLTAEHDALDDEPLARNGTFLVYRKLWQNVAAFDAFLARHAEIPDLAERLVGRRRDGRPLIESSEPFTYERDPQGERCPVGAHARRMNPRTRAAGIRRIMIRGIPYGSAGEVDRGLIFLAINASIRRQFEFLQRQWANDGNRFGLWSGERDPLIGAHPAGHAPFTLAPGQVLNDVERFVETRGGEYLFVPSRAGLELLSGINAPRVEV